MTRFLMTAVLALVAWTWTTETGVQSWTDDRERIPARYAEQAERVEIGVLADYDRFSTAAPSAKTSEAPEDATK